MSAPNFWEAKREKGFSLVELMVGLTIGFIAVAVILQTLSVFESHKRTTVAAADAQENGLLALMAIEDDIRKAASGFNHPAAFSCGRFYSYYSDSGSTPPITPTPVSAFATFPVLIDDDVSKSPMPSTMATVPIDSVKIDQIHVRSGGNFTGSNATWITADMAVGVYPIQLQVERGFEFRGDPPTAAGPAADLILVANSENIAGLGSDCALFKVSSVTGNILTIQNGTSTTTTKEFNPPQSYLTSNGWPGFGTPTAGEFKLHSYVYRVGIDAGGGVIDTVYSINANNTLQANVFLNGATPSPGFVASGIVALQAQYGVSSTKDSRVVNEWVNPTGAEWGYAALTATSSTAADNRQRIKAIRIALVARSGQRDGAIVTSACTDNHTTNYGPCSWTDDSSTYPAPAIDLRASAGDTEWQHYRYKVYQTVIPMRNVLWPAL